MIGPGCVGGDGGCGNARELVRGLPHHLHAAKTLFHPLRILRYLPSESVLL